MFDQSTQPEKTDLEKAIDDAFRELNNHDAHSDEYKKIVDQLSKLYALQKLVEDYNLRTTEMVNQQSLNEMDAQQRLADAEARVRLAEADARLKDIEGAAMMKDLDKKFWQRLNPDTLALVAGNLVGIGLVLGYERGHVMVTKAFNYVLKSK